MNFAGLLVLTILFIIANTAFSLILPRRQLLPDCSAWKGEYFTPCYVAECEETCGNQRGTCLDRFPMSSEYCRPGCVCAPGFVRDNHGICTIASLICRYQGMPMHVNNYQDLADSFSRDPVWSGLGSGRNKNRRRRLRYIV